MARVDAPLTDGDIDAAMRAARTLIAWGVPIFLARPARDCEGQWQPESGYRGTGYWFPKGWNRRRPDPAVLLRWRPGTALCAVMGHGVDLLDVDPRNGGRASQFALPGPVAGRMPLPWRPLPREDRARSCRRSASGQRTASCPALTSRPAAQAAAAGSRSSPPPSGCPRPPGRSSPTGGSWSPPRQGHPPTTPPAGSWRTSVWPSSGPREPGGASGARATHTSWTPDWWHSTTGTSRAGRIRGQTAQIAELLAAGPRHRAVLGPLVQLLRLAREGHQGLAGALQHFGEDFTARVGPHRPGGEQEARDEGAAAGSGGLEAGHGALSDQVAFELRECAERHEPFDVVIDDASHIPALTNRSFEILFPLLADGGVYVIEDIGTSYWPMWGGRFGRRRRGTSMALVKDRLDGLNHAEFKWPTFIPTELDRTIAEVRARHGIVAFIKGSNDIPSDLNYAHPISSSAWVSADLMPVLVTRSKHPLVMRTLKASGVLPAARRLRRRLVPEVHR